MVDMRAGSAVAQTIPNHTYSAICPHAVAERTPDTLTAG
jgi:hypothetical protein